MMSESLAFEGFLGGCLHQDWELDAEGGDEMSLVRQFGTEGRLGRVFEAIGQIVALEALRLPDVELENWLTRHGSYFVPTGSGAARSWLVQVREALVSLAAARMSRG